MQLLRDNDAIDYSKLGLSGVKLHRTEVLYNIAIVEKSWATRTPPSMRTVISKNSFSNREILKVAQKMDATRYSIKTDFISLERQMFVQKVYHMKNTCVMNTLGWRHYSHNRWLCSICSSKVV